MGKSTVTTARLRASQDLRARVEADSCPECHDMCWTVEVWACDLQGTDARACLLYRPHVETQAAALSTLGRWQLGQVGALRAAEQAAYLLEHQQTLW